MQRPVNEPKLKRIFLFQLLLSLVLGPVIGLWLHAREPAESAAIRFPWFWADLGIPLALVVFICSTLITLDRKMATAAHALGTPEVESAGASLRTFMAIGVGLMLPSVMVLANLGWRWALPFYALYFVYLFQVYLRWRRYRQTLTLEAGQ